MGIDTVTHNQPFFQYIFSIINLSFRVATPPREGDSFRNQMQHSGGRSAIAYPKTPKNGKVEYSSWVESGELRELRERRTGWNI